MQQEMKTDDVMNKLKSKKYDEQNQKTEELLNMIKENKKRQKQQTPEQMLHDKVLQHNDNHNHMHNRNKAMYIRHTDEHPHVSSNSFLFVLLTVIGCQLGIWYWRKRHPHSFFLFTLFGLWAFPILISMQLRYWRMIFIWTIFTIIFGVLLKMSRSKPMNRKTPRFLYSWFYFLYKLTNILSIVGYVLFLADFFGLGILIFGPHPDTERQYRNKLMHHQHEQHLHAIAGDNDLESVKEEMKHEREELIELQHGYHHIHFSDIGIYLLFYGLYYGVLARDTAQLCATWISSALGFFNPSGFPRRRVPANICAVCNNPLIDHNIGLFDINEDDDTDNDSNISLPNGKDKDRRSSTMDRRMRLMNKRKRMEEKTQNALNENKRGFPWNLCSFSNTKQDEEIELSCGHRFHGFCIRGWIMIGKRDVCPVCKEKVNLKGIFANPWQKQDRMWSQLLDGVRYLMVWNPVIVLAANLVFNVSGLSFTNKAKHH